MDNKKNDWMSGKSQNNEPSSCGCGGGSTQFDDQKMDKKDQTMANDQMKNEQSKKDQMKNDSSQNVEGKSCDAGIDGIIITETVSTFYPLNDDISDEQSNQDLNNRLNDDSEDLTDNR